MTRAIIAAAVALGVICSFTGAAFLALAFSVPVNGSGAESRLIDDPYLWRVARFTVWQAALSTLISIAAAVPLARSLDRRRSFAGRTALIRLLALPFVLPALVLVLGIVEVWGQQGWINDALRLAGFQPVLKIYGLTGILIAHVTFNMPLATRLLLAHLERIPPETWRLAAQLDMPPGAVFRLIEWPVLRAGLPGIAGLIFLLCITSFTIVLTLGGGPAATTMEVAIYQALRFDFDPARAVVLSLAQIALCGALLMAGARFATTMTTAPSLAHPLAQSRIRPGTASALSRIGDAAIICAAVVFLGLPLGAIALSGLAAPLGKLAGDAAVARAIMTSLALAALAGSICLALTLMLVSGVRAANARRDKTMHLARIIAPSAGACTSLILVVPPIVLGAGWFVLLRGTGDVFAFAPMLVIAINALMAMPFAFRVVMPAVAAAAHDHDRLCASLGIAGWHRAWLIDFPRLKRPLSLALAFAAALSIGDLGAIALFGSEKLTTLPLLLYQRMANYRIDDAAGLALVLAVICLGLMAIAEAAGKTAGKRS